MATPIHESVSRGRVACSINGLSTLIDAHQPFKHRHTARNNWAVSVDKVELASGSAYVINAFLPGRTRNAARVQRSPVDLLSIYI
jgi:hypothetical protein